MEKMIASTQLAALDHNNNVNRDQKYKVKEEPQFCVAYSKANKRFVAKAVKNERNYDYIKEIVTEIIKRSAEETKATRKKRLKRQSTLQIAPLERPSREEVIQKSTSFKQIKL